MSYFRVISRAQKWNNLLAFKVSNENNIICPGILKKINLLMDQSSGLVL